jgi:hypothetical protein
MILTDSQYHFMLARADQPDVKKGEGSDSELAAIYRSSVAEAGGYVRGDGSLRLTPDIAVNPTDEGVEYSAPFTRASNAIEIEIRDHKIELEKVE